MRSRTFATIALLVLAQGTQALAQKAPYSAAYPSDDWVRERHRLRSPYDGRKDVEVHRAAGVFAAGVFAAGVLAGEVVSLSSVSAQLPASLPKWGRYLGATALVVASMWGAKEAIDAYFYGQAGEREFLWLRDRPVDDRILLKLKSDIELRLAAAKKSKGIGSYPYKQAIEERGLKRVQEDLTDLLNDPISPDIRFRYAYLLYPEDQELIPAPGPARAKGGPAALVDH